MISIMSSEYTLNECERMLAAMNMKKIAIDLKTIPNGMIRNGEFNFTQSGRFYAVCRSGEISTVTTLHHYVPDEYCRRRISITVSFEYATMIRREIEKRTFNDLQKILHKYHRINPRVNGIISM